MAKKTNSEKKSQSGKRKPVSTTPEPDAGKTVPPFEVTRIRKSGEPITVWLHVSTLVDDKGRPVKFATFERPLSR